VDATNSGPSKTILTGDRNLQAGGQAVRPGLFALATNLDLSWTGEMHSKGGLLAFVDGHVEFVRTNKLNDTILSQPLATNRVCVP
jgi:prepilin-type processing-associated H-X9-DG protein